VAEDAPNPRDGANAEIVPPEVVGTASGSSVAPQPEAPTPSDVPIAPRDVTTAGSAFTSLSVVDPQRQRAESARANTRRTALGEWTTGVDAILRAGWRYPESRAAMGVSGSATVAFVVDRNGRVRNARLVVSSGDDMIDAAALAAIPRVVPAPPRGSRPVPFRITFRGGSAP
jgi:protein TonB